MALTRTRFFQLELEGRELDGNKQRTFAAVLSTEAPVRRVDRTGREFFEVLSHAPGAVDLSRVPLPLIESHDQRTLPIGIVDNVQVVDGKLRGIVTFGSSARAQEIADDVEAGIIRGLSVGYSIEETVEEFDGDQLTIIATRWTPLEVSAVAVPADAGAGFGRSHSHTMGTNTNDQTTETTDAAKLERERCAAITRLTRMLGDEGPATAARLIQSGVTIADARRIVSHRIAERDTLHFDRRSMSEMLGHGVIVTAGADTATEFRNAAVDALLLRAGVPLVKPHPASRDVSGSVLDLARTCVSRAGRSHRGSNEDLIRRAMSTSDFPLILADAMHKAVRRGYETEPSSHRSWVRAQPVSDFRDQHRVILGSAPALEPVVEGGEYTNGSLNEDATSYRVAKYGRVVTLTWETLVNDNLGTFLRIQPAMGQAARRLEADTVYDLFAANGGAGPTMQDSKALFHVDHANLGTAAPFDAAALGAARALLRKQQALGGGYLSLVPRFLIVPVELEQAAEVLVAQATRAVTTVDTATPRWIAALEVIVEPRLDPDAFYLAADSAQIDTCELGLLEENFAGPTIVEDRSEEFRRDVLAWKVRHVIGAKFLDWRGIVKQPISTDPGEEA